MKSKYNYTSVILTTEMDYTALYEDYLVFCADVGRNPAPEDSEEFYTWADDQTQFLIQEDFEAISREKAYIADLVITGALGLWNGIKEIEPIRVRSVSEALMRCIGGNNDYTVTYDNGLIKIRVVHHDGTNNFVVRPVDKRKKLPYLYVL